MSNVNYPDGNLGFPEGGGGASSLQAAYDGGATITIGPNGPVVIDKGATTSAPLLLTPQAAAPTGVAGEEWRHTDGNTYYWDNGRSKFLTGVEETWTFGKNGNANNNYLDPGPASSSVNGYPAPGKITLTSVYIRATGNLTKTFQVQKDGSLVNSVTLVAGVVIDGAMDIDFVQEEDAQIFATSEATAATDVVAVIGFKRRP